jgi:hypothetical protein
MIEKTMGARLPVELGVHLLRERFRWSSGSRGKL